VTPDLLPLTYEEMRARFRRAARRAGAAREAHPIDAPGPDGQQLTIDVATLGPADAAGALIVLSGVHGVEAPLNSTLQSDLLCRITAEQLGPLRLILVHGVNPWGMAHWRRQNESNVDLNRNWDRDNTHPPRNEPYDQVHPFLCPAGPAPPTPESFLEPALALVERCGIEWIHRAIASGQYAHPDGLHFGGTRTEQSNRIVGEAVGRLAAGIPHTLCLDLHTGDGAYGTCLILSRSAAGSTAHEWTAERFHFVEVRPAAGDPVDPGGGHGGHLAPGLGGVLDSAHRALTVEFGTVPDDQQVVAARLENWLYHHGDRSDPAWAHVLEENRANYTPEDPEWVRTCLAQGRRVLDEALAALGS
jgi:polar amino acid transport system ATP-binding protein